MANIHIEGSSLMTQKEFIVALNDAPHDQDYREVREHRSLCSLRREWAAHKLLYDLHAWRNHTQSVDLNYPQKWYVRVAYLIVGSIGLIFYR